MAFKLPWSSMSQGRNGSEQPEIECPSSQSSCIASCTDPNKEPTVGRGVGHFTQVTLYIPNNHAWKWDFLSHYKCRGNASWFREVKQFAYPSIALYVLILGL